MVMVGNSTVTALRELMGLDLFVGTDRSLLADVAARGIELHLPEGHVLMRAGSEAREFVVILDGHAEVVLAGSPLAYLGPGSCCGEMSLVDRHRRTADVRAQVPMRVFVLSREDFFLLLERSPAFVTRVLTTVVGRLRLANVALAVRTDRS